MKKTYHHENKHVTKNQEKLKERYFEKYIIITIML